jgi:cytochrome c553
MVMPPPARRLVALEVSALAIVVTSCAGRSPSAAEAARWSTMTEADRVAYMTSTVMPSMKALFTEFDARRYSKMTCATCHGHDGEQRRWKMPNPDLLLEIEAVTSSPPPHGGHGPGAAQMDAFMKTKVAPRMAQLLGKAPSDKAADKGEACFVCHTLDR